MTISGPAEPPITIFERRREAATAALGDGVMVLPAAPIQYSSRDQERPYHPDRELYYLSGLTEPESVAVLVGGEDPRFVLFVRERDAVAELWTGPRLGPEAAAERFGPDQCFGISELAERLPGLLHAGDRIHFRLGRGGGVEELVLGALAHARTRGARTGTGPRGVTDPGEILNEMRLIKDEVEIDRLRQAAVLSADGHRAAARALAPGVGEWVVESVIDSVFRAGGGRGPAYETIVGAGANACVLHYVAKGDRVGEGDLVLIDAGAELGLYNGDITRTYPASGRFSERQRDVYDLVDVARARAIEVIRPGVSIASVHDAAVHTLTDGLVQLGVLDGPVDELVESGAYKDYFPHQTSHWLGLDVHDPGDYGRGGVARRLEPGMVFTVEPGLYFPPEDAGARATDFSGIGVRIEDDVLVTEEGCEVLTADLPTAPADIEALVEAPS